MTTTLDIKLEIGSWDEQPYREFEDDRKFARAEVTLRGTGSGSDGIESATFEGLMFYRADGTSSQVTLMHITGSLDGRSGSSVLQGSGSYDGTTASGPSRIVAGSGTGELSGISGAASSSSTHADYPFMPLKLSYDLG